MPDGKVSGTVYLVDEVRTYGSKGTFKKRLVVLEQPGERSSNLIPVEFIQEDVQMADTMRVGEEVEIEFDLKGREWQRDANSEKRYFLNAQVCRWTSLKAPPDRQQEFDDAKSEKQGGGNIPDDEIPF